MKKKTKKKLAEGFSPIYNKGQITPGTKGLGPKQEKDLRKKIQKASPSKASKKRWQNIGNIRNLV